MYKKRKRKKIKILLILTLLVCCISIFFYRQSQPYILSQALDKEHEMHIDACQVALVMGGGGSRGLAHLGVLKVFQENNIPIDLIIGCSSGSIIGALYADNSDIQRLEDITLNVSHKDLLDISLFNLFHGPVQGNALRNYLLKHLNSQNFQDLKIPLIVVATDLNSGKLVSILKGPIVPAVHASSALPPVFAPVNLHGKLLVDGAILDPVPVNVARNYKPKLIIAIDVSCSHKPIPPPSHIFDVTTRSIELALEDRRQIKLQEADVIIRPNVGDTHMFDGSQNHMLYQAGIEAAKASLVEIRKKLKEQKVLLREQT